MTTITKKPLGKNGPLVSNIGLGCMRMSPVFGAPQKDEAECIATIREALDSGINFLNTADFYGNGHNELLISKAIKGRRNDAFISVKFGAIIHSGNFLGLDIRPLSIKNFINYSLVRLGVEAIDLYQPCRLDNSVPVEEVAGTIADMVKEGKVRYAGMPAINAEQLQKAYNTFPVTAMEVPYSLADRKIEQEILPAARALGIGIVAFANTADRLLTGTTQSPLPPHDYRNRFPRFQGENLVKNLDKVKVLTSMAKTKGYTPAQLAIAWVYSQGKDIMPLVGMSHRSRLPENIQSLDITFTREELDTLHSTFTPGSIIGDTYHR